MGGALPTASGMRKLYPSRVWCSREGMIPFSPMGLQSDCKGLILTKSGLWLDLRRHRLGVKRDTRWKTQSGDDARGCHRVPAVTMVESPILVATSASRLMYLSPLRASGGRRVCSSKTFPSPPSSTMYSIPKWACRDSTLSRNQLTAPGLVRFSFTQNVPRQWLITGTYEEWTEPPQ